MVFTGIVQTTANAKYVEGNPTYNIVIKASPNYFNNSKSGDSVAINGVCLTLRGDPTGDVGEFFIMNETLSKTAFELVMGDSKEFAVNVEHAMRMGDSVGGHKVSGHVHGIGKIIEMKYDTDGSCNVWIDISNSFSEFSSPPVVHKGSICFDGTSLTVAELRNNSTHVRVSLIPYTLQHTIFHTKKVGDFVNIEYDHDLIAAQGLVKNWEAETKPDEYFMGLAIAQGEKGRLTAPPNPWVGSVIVSSDRKTILGEGFHRKAGEPHAEVNAIKNAKALGNGDQLAGATIYVTLEPCHHTGRTPPCDQLLVTEKIARVVVGVLDPDTRVSGAGVEHLRAHGIEVVHGVAHEQVIESLRPYLHQRQTKRPYVLLKSALSLDAKIACQDGTSKWITGPAARAQGHLLRAKSQAILVGSRTAVIDKPLLNVRDVPGAENKPLRVVVDTKGVVLDGPLLDVSLAPTLIFHSAKAPATSLEKWSKAGVESVCVEVDGDERIKLSLVLDELGKRGIIQLLVEGGAELHSEFLKQHFVDELAIFYGACILGNSAQQWTRTNIFNTIGDVRFWKLANVQQLDNDIFALYRNIPK